jgi:hypothetical protein
LSSEVVELRALADVRQLAGDRDAEQDPDGERDEDSRQGGHVVAEAEHRLEGT